VSDKVTKCVQCGMGRIRGVREEYWITDKGGGSPHAGVASGNVKTTEVDMEKRRSSS